MLLAISGCTTIKSNMDSYDDYVATVPNAKAFMPSLDSLGDYIQSAVNLQSRDMLIYKSDSIILFVLYTKEDYDEKKEELQKSHSFLSEAVYDKNGKTRIIPEVSAFVNGYTIKVADNRKTDKNYSFPKSFGMVGYNDDINAIAYMYFSDDELDYIKSLPKFITEYFVFEARQ